MKYKDSIRLPELEKIYNNFEDSTDEQLKPIVDEYFSKNEYITINNIQYRFLRYITIKVYLSDSDSNIQYINRLKTVLESIKDNKKYEFFIQMIVSHIYLYYENTTI